MLTFNQLSFWSLYSNMLSCWIWWYTLTHILRWPTFMSSGLSALISQASEQTETPRLGVSQSGLKQASKNLCVGT